MTAIPIMDDTSVDSGVPWHYGNPLGEQRTFLSESARVDLSHYGIVTVTGVDRLSWLHTLTTQKITETTKSCQTLILSPHGHIEHDIHFVDDGETSWLIVEPGTAEALVKYLKSMQFMLRVDIHDVTNDFAVIGASGWITDNSYPTWLSPSEYLNSQSQDYVPHRPYSWQVSEYIVPRENLATELSAHTLVGTWAWEAMRIRAGVPRLSFETDHKTIPHEIGLIASAVHLNKGCYRGQETVARVYNLGKPPRRLVALEIDGSTNELPTVGSPVMWNNKEVGRLTSITQDFEHGPLGLAVIKRSVPLDEVLIVGSVSASQTAIVV